MKKINIITLLLIALIGFVGCQDDDDNYLKLNEGDFVKPVLKANIEEGLVVTLGNMKEVAGTWEWTVAEFGIPSVIKYEILIDTDKAMTNAQHVYEYEVAGKPQEFTNQVINDAIQTFLPEGAAFEDMVETTYYLAVKAYLGTAGVVSPLFSEPVEVKFTPMPSPKPKDVIYVVGNTLVGWNNAVAAIGEDLQLMFTDSNDFDDKTYTYTGVFNPGGMKFITQAGEWKNAFGFSGGALVPDNGGEDMPGPDTEGLYTLTVDVQGLTAKLTAYTGDANGKKYDKIGLIGSATAGGWDSDTSLKQVTDYVWIGKDIQLSVGELKFRANGDWAVNWGDKNAAQQQIRYGVGVQDQDNIKIELEGKYFVSINTLTGHYIIVAMEDLP